MGVVGLWAKVEREEPMKRSAWIVAITLLAVLPPVALAQQSEQPLTDKQLQGRNLFAQSCIVCHVKVQVTTLGQYGPVLSKMSLGGQEDLMREFISNGTPNMPGFKYHFRPDQIDAIVAYLKTLPVPAPTAAAPANPPH
jgi:mono/diheme cytochrome c family protein